MFILENFKFIFERYKEYENCYLFKGEGVHSSGVLYFCNHFFSEKIHQKDKKILCISFLETFGFKSIKHNRTAPQTAIFTAAPQSEKIPKKNLKNAEWG